MDVVLDSSVWIELLAIGPLAALCQKEFDAASAIIVPTLVIFEVYRKIAKQVSEDLGLSAVAFMNQQRVVDLSQEVALTAADLSLQYRLPMADSIVLAHAHQASAALVTLDNDFAAIPSTKVLRKTR